MVNPVLTDFVREKNIVLTVYTDGSKINDSVSYALICDRSVVETNKLHPMTSIYTAEAIAILKAVEFIIAIPVEGQKAIVTDSRSVLEELSSSNSKKSEITNLIKNSLNKNTSIIWVPSHLNIRGNDFADEIAKKKQIWKLKFLKTVYTYKILIETSKYFVAK